MATYYFDSILGNDTTGNGSQELPWAQYNNKYGSVADGDECLFKRGTIQTITTQFFAPRHGLSAATPFRMGAYGEGRRPVFRFGGTVWGYMFNLSNRRWVTIEDIDWDAQGLPQSTLYVAAQGTGQCYGHRFSRCDFFGSLDRQGISVAKEDTSTTGATTDIVFTDCRAYDNGGHGFYVCAATAVRYVRCQAFRNGSNAVFGGHGFSARWNRTTITSGWTLVSGAIYKRTLTAGEAAGAVTYMNSTPYAEVRKNASTPTTPSAGEFGVAGGELYVNLGVNPNGGSISYAWGRCADIGYIDCLAYGNIADLQAVYLEGHGIALDDFTEDSFIERCVSHSNDGVGVSINRGNNNAVRNSMLYNNGAAGVLCSASDGVSIISCTIARNNMGSPYLPAGTSSELSFSGGANSGTIRNTCIIARPGGNTYGINVDPAATGWSVSHCNITGFTTAVRTVAQTSAVSGDPQLTASYRPMAGSPLLDAGTHLGYTRDIERKQRQNPPCIGAYDAATLQIT